MLVFLLQGPLRCYCVTVRLIVPPLCVDVLLEHSHHGINRSNVRKTNPTAFCLPSNIVKFSCYIFTI